MKTRAHIVLFHKDSPFKSNRVVRSKKAYTRKTKHKKDLS